MGLVIRFHWASLGATRIRFHRASWPRPPGLSARRCPCSCRAVCRTSNVTDRYDWPSYGSDTFVSSTSHLQRSLSLSLFRSDFLDTRIHSSSLAWIVGKAMVLYKGCFSRSFFRVYCKAMVPEVFRTNGSKTLSWPTRRQQYGLRPRRHGFPFVLHGLQGHLHSSWATSKNGSAWTNPTLRSVAQTGVLSMV